MSEQSILNATRLTIRVLLENWASQTGREILAALLKTRCKAAQVRKAISEMQKAVPVDPPVTKDIANLQRLLDAMEVKA